MKDSFNFGKVVVKLSHGQVVSVAHIYLSNLR